MRNRLLTLLLAAVFALTAAAFAQVPNITDVTSTPVPGVGHSYLHGLNETVNPANGSVTLRFCVPVPRGRGLTVPFCIVYNSDGAHFLISRNAGSLVWSESLSEFGRYSPWSYTVPRVTVQAVDVALTDGSGGTCRVAVDYVYHGARGGRHAVGLSIFGQAPGEAGIDGNCNTAGLTLSTSGGDGPILATTTQVPNNPSGVPGTFELEPVTVTTADGTRYQFPSLSGDLLSPADPATVVASSVEDKNGNTVPISSSASNVTYTDTLGRTAVALTNASSTQDSVAVSGVSGQTLVNWGPQNYSFNVTMTHVAGTQACTENTNSASDSEIQSIVLPNGDTYSFGYDPTTGLVNRISYPGGGVVTYTWNETPTSSEYGSWAGPISADGGGSTGPCDYYYATPVITDRWVSFGGSSVLHQHFDYSTTWGSTQGQWTQKQTTVTSYDLVRGGSFQTIYKYSPEFVIPQINTQDYLTSQIPVEQEIDHYDWSGAELSRVVETWLNP